jgi:hypothetical protein
MRTGEEVWRVKSRCSSVVEHFLGKEEVWGSIPHNGSIFETVKKLKNNVLKDGLR